MPTLSPEDRQRVRGEWAIEERWPEERRLIKESDAYEGRESVCRFESRQDDGPSHDVDSGGDGITLDGGQREEHRSAMGGADPGDELHTGIQQVE